MDCYDRLRKHLFEFKHKLYIKLEFFYYNLVQPKPYHVNTITGQSDWIEIQITDEDGNPLAYEDYILYLPNGEKREGKTDDNGFVKERDIPSGEISIEFLNIEEIELEK